jgi:hypothetical protein
MTSIALSYKFVTALPTLEMNVPKIKLKAAEGLFFFFTIGTKISTSKNIQTLKNNADVLKNTVPCHGAASSV